MAAEILYVQNARQIIHHKNMMRGENEMMCYKASELPADMPYALRRRLAWDIGIYGICFYEKRNGQYFRTDRETIKVKKDATKNIFSV